MRANFELGYSCKILVSKLCYFDWSGIQNLDFVEFWQFLDGKYRMTVKDMINTSYESNNHYCQKDLQTSHYPKS